jgi:hypothetical protein
MRIVGYTYRAANYCDDYYCIVSKVLKDRGLEGHGLSFLTEEALHRLAVSEGIDRYDERTYDSDDFPKIIVSDQIEEDETCDKCGRYLK